MLEANVERILSKVFGKLARIPRLGVGGRWGRVSFSFSRELPSELRELIVVADTSALSLYNTTVPKVTASGQHEARGLARFEAEETEGGGWRGSLRLLYARADASIPFKSLVVRSDTSAVKVSSRSALERAVFYVDTSSLNARLEEGVSSVSLRADTSGVKMAFGVRPRRDVTVDLNVDSSKVIMVIVSEEPPTVVDEVEKRSSHIDVGIPEGDGAPARLVLRGRVVSSSFTLKWERP